MSQHSQQKTPEQIVDAIFALDLDPIKFKLMDKKEGHGWSRAQADQAELEYKRFLVLLAKYPDEVIAPDTTVDKFWHGHILDTMKYAEDCQNVFGYFLHHFPYFGLRDKEDAANLTKAAQTMRRLYEQEFGAAQADDSAYCGMANVSYCGKANVSYCGQASVSYCGKASDQVAAALVQTHAWSDVVTGKGRPKLAQASSV